MSKNTNEATKSINYLKGKQLIISIILYAIGIVVMPLGVVLTINSHVGAGGYDALNFALGDSFHIKTSYAIYATALVAVIVTAIVRRSFPRITTFISSFLIGFTTDFWKWALDGIEGKTFLSSLGLLLLGMVVIGLAVASYMLSHFPTNPTDDFIVALKEKGVSIKVAKISFDLFCMVVAFFCGGEISWGTLVITFGLGLVIDFFHVGISKLTKRQ